MGGFAVDLSQIKPTLHPKGYDKLVVSREFLEFLAKYLPERIPNISESEILDKSKASGLAKVLVCVQALWFCIQCLNRLIQGFAISLLELNTFAHAICTLLIYLLWWRKPLDIEEPSLLTDDKVIEATAYYFSWPIQAKTGLVTGDTRVDDLDFSQTRVFWEYEGPTVASSGSEQQSLPSEFLPNDEKPSGAQVPPASQPELSEARQQEFALRFPVNAGCLRMYRDEKLHGFTFRPPYSGGDDISLIFVDLSPAQQRQLQLSQQFLQNETVPSQYHYEYNVWPSGNCVRNWEFIDFSDMVDFWGVLSSAGLRMILGFWISGLVYGGLHFRSGRSIFLILGSRRLLSQSYILIFFCY